MLLQFCYETDIDSNSSWKIGRNLMVDTLVESTPKALSFMGLAEMDNLTEFEKPSVDGTMAIEAPVQYALETVNLNVFYGDFRAIRDTNLRLRQHKITAIIGPSGCGKSTLLRAFNRMNELVPTAHTQGQVVFRGENIYQEYIDPVEVRRRIGMVFQKPNPFPKSIYENVAWGARINGFRGNMDKLVEESLQDAALWDEVSGKLDQSGLSLSGGQQQRLCIARTIAVRPDIILMDEPCSALDPIATLRIEELMRELSKQYTIIIVTHNMQQAARVSDYTAMMMLDEDQAGQMIEYDRTQEIFTRPKKQRTEDYITGRFG
jgi:phosphate transport system ATP-binding protein